MQLGPDTPASSPEAAANTINETQQPAAQGDVYALDGTQTQPGGIQGWVDSIRAENSMLPNILIIGAMVIVVVLVMRSLKRTSQANKARFNAMGTPSERIAEIREQAQSSMEPGRKLMVDAEDVARRMGAALDNKAARLELLIEEADLKLDQLNRAIAKSEGRSPGASIGEETQSVPSPSPSRALDPTVLDRARVEQDYEERQSRVAGRIEPDPVQQPTRQPEPEPEITISDQIQALASAGKSSKEIATALQQPIGQVELILNLRKRAEHS